MTPSDPAAHRVERQTSRLPPHCGVCAQARRTAPVTPAMTRYLGGSGAS
jgi:hypothetical protein